MIYAREFLDLGASFPEIDEGKIERKDDAAHMDGAHGNFYHRVRPIGDLWGNFYHRVRPIGDLWGLHYLHRRNVVLHSIRRSLPSTVLRPPTKTTKPGLNCQRKDE